MGLIELQHLGTSGIIIGGLCSVALVSFIVEVVYNYVKKRLEQKKRAKKARKAWAIVRRKIGKVKGMEAM